MSPNVSSASDSPSRQRRGSASRAVVFLMALGLIASACGGDDDKASSVKDDTKLDSKDCPVDALAKVDKPVEITFWHSMADANESVLRSMIDDYNASQSRVKVNLQFQGSYDDTAKKYVATLRQGDLPQLVQLHEIYPQMMIDTKSTMAVQTCFEASKYDLSDYLSAPLNQFKVDGIQWSMPFNTSVPVLYYNKVAFERAGLDPERPPTTFDEVRAASEKIVSSGAARSGVAFELKADPVTQWMSIASQDLVDHGNGRMERATKSTFDTQKGLKIYQFMKSMIDDKLAISVGRNKAGVDHLLALTKGDAAMAIYTSAALGGILDVLGSGQFPDVQPGVAFMPGLVDPKAKGGVFVGGGSLHIVKKGSTPLQRAAAWDLIRWLDEPAQQARLHEGTGYIPIRKSAAELPSVVALWKDNPLFRVGYDELAASGNAVGSAALGNYPSVEDIIVASLERMILKGQEPAATVAQANREATDSIKKYNDRLRS